MTWVSSPAVRRARAEQAHRALGADMAAWFAERRARPADELRRQGHQLRTIDGVLQRALDRVGGALAQTPLDDSAFPRALGIEAQLGVIERYWRFYRERLEQRDDPARRRMLAAADEVTWSCFTGLGGEDPTAVPLPYAEPTGSPIATPRSMVPQSLRPSDRALAELLNRLPIPLIAFPTGLLASPWWLALLAHEVGHHIQYDLEPEQALVGRTGDALAAAVGDAAARWLPWRFELFADACSVVAVGTAAIYAIAELEWSPLAAMCADRSAYPPVIVRLAVMAELARALGLPPSDLGVARWQAELAAAGPVKPQLAADLALAPAVAGALAAIEVGGRPLRDRADAEALGAPGLGAIRDRLAGKPVLIRPGRRTPRLVAAAALERHQALPAGGDAALAEATLALIEMTCDGTPRAARDPAGTIAHCAEIFEDQLDKLSAEARA